MGRCFVGIMVPEHIRDVAISLQKRLAEFGMKCKFVEPKNMHICLSFLGEVDDRKIEDLKRALDAVAERYKSFDIKIGKMKFIPSENYIRVIVLSVDDLLERMRKAVVEAVGGDSKPPHLTLCRVKYVDDKKRFVNEFGEVVCGETFRVGSIQLIKSELQRSGPVYTVIHESRLS